MIGKLSYNQVEQIATELNLNKEIHVLLENTNGSK